MGLALPSLRFILRQHKRQPFTGPVLTLGRQCIYGTYAEVKHLFQQEKVPFHPLPKNIARTTNIPAWKNTAYANNVSDVTFFYMLTGQPAFALDSSEYEDAEYIWDLNNPIHKAWHNQFPTIIDSGTLEHLFNTKQALQNIHNLLTPNGRIIHMSPANNYMEHGFYQFSPTFFYDYYGVNKFTNLTCYIAEQPLSQLDHGRWNFWQWHTKRPYLRVTSKHMIAIYFHAQKTAESTLDKIPQQGDYLKNADKGMTQTRSLNPTLEKIYTLTPRWLTIAIKRILGIDKTIKPWDLKYRGKY